MVRKIGQLLDPSTELFPERRHTIRIGQEKQQVVQRSIGMFQPRLTVAYRLAPECASPI
jgi:hypothetical protein